MIPIWPFVTQNHDGRKIIVANKINSKEFANSQNYKKLPINIWEGHVPFATFCAAVVAAAVET